MLHRDKYISVGLRGFDAISEMIDVTRDTADDKYLPDFTVKAVGSVLYLRIGRALYVAALRATKLHHEQMNGGTVVALEDMFGGGPWCSLTPEYELLVDSAPTYEARSSDRTRLLSRNGGGPAVPPPPLSVGEGVEARTNSSVIVGEATVIIDPDVTKHSHA